MKRTLRLWPMNGIIPLAGVILLLNCCKEDRTTVIYGRVVDSDQQPVDSIMVITTGSGSIPETLQPGIAAFRILVRKRDGTLELEPK